MLHVGDTVQTRWGRAKVKTIEIVEAGKKSGGQRVEKVPVEFLDGRNIILVLDNGKWAYGHEIKVLEAV